MSAGLSMMQTGGVATRRAGAVAPRSSVRIPRTSAVVQHNRAVKACARPSWADESEGAKMTYDLLFNDDTKLPEAVSSNEFFTQLKADQGWTEAAETLNGRAAMLGALHMTLTTPFLGDVLVQVANTPAPLALLLPVLTAASIAPRMDKIIVPDSVRGPIMEQWKSVDGPEIFTPELERAVGRLAMMAMGGFVTLAVIF